MAVQPTTFIHQLEHSIGKLATSPRRTPNSCPSSSATSPSNNLRSLPVKLKTYEGVM